MFFWNSLAFSMIQCMMAIWSLVLLIFKSSLNIWKFSVHVLLKPDLENFEHYFARVWDECNCVLVWTFLGIALLWNWNENWPFPVLCHCWVFQICWHIDCNTFTASSFRIWNSLTGIPSPPLALFVVMLPKTHLTSHSRMSGSRWVITPSWLSGLCRSFLYRSSVYSCHLFLIILLWQNVVHWKREWKTTSAFLPWESHEQYEERKKGTI